MRGRLLLLALLALALLPGAARGASWEAPPEAPLISTRYARVFGDAAARSLAEEVGALIDAAAPKAARVTGTTDVRPVQARVYRDRRRFSAATGVPRDSPTVGLAVFPSETIYVDGSGVFASVRRVVPHEVGHVMEWRALGPEAGALPRWFGEGVAEYIASPEPAYVDPVALAALRQGGTIPLSNLEGAFQDPHLVGTAYAEASSLVSFLVERHGEQSVAQVLAALRATGDFPRALQQSTGLSEAQFAAAWQEWLRRRWPYLPDLNLLLWFVMVLLLAIALVRALRERRRRREESEADLPHET